MGHPSLSLVRYDLEGHDPWWNLAAEEHLARTCPPATVRLVFYRNMPALVFGRNQNPWAEADLGEAARCGAALARRSSGGGTVFHDRGTLNYGFAMHRPLYEPGRFLAMVAEALAALGIPAVVCPRNSIWVSGRKIAGTAFLLTGERALLHGCILVDSDLGLLRRLLRLPVADLRSHAVPSVPSPVLCVREVQRAVTPEALREAIAAAAARGLGAVCRRAVSAEDLPPDAVAAAADRLRSWEWLFGRTPDFAHVLYLPCATVVLRVAGARIAGVETPGCVGIAARLGEALAGLPYDGLSLAAASGEVPGLEAGLRDALRAALRREIPALGAFGAAGRPAPLRQPGQPPAQPVAPRRVRA